MVVEAAPPDADASQVRDPDEEEEPDGRQNRFLENRRRAMALAAAGWPTRAEQVAQGADPCEVVDFRGLLNPAKKNQQK